MAAYNQSTVEKPDKQLIIETIQAQGTVLRQMHSQLQKVQDSERVYREGYLTLRDSLNKR
jgi:hypothetical protein